MILYQKIKQLLKIPEKNKENFMPSPPSPLEMLFVLTSLIFIFVLPTILLINSFKYGLAISIIGGAIYVIIAASLIRTVNTKTDDAELCQLKIRKTDDNIWYTIWENEEGETEDIEDKTIEGVIKKVMLDNDYVGISPR